MSNPYYSDFNGLLPIDDQGQSTLCHLHDPPLLFTSCTAHCSPVRPANMVRSSSSTHVKSGTMSAVSSSVRQRGGPNVKKGPAVTSPTRDSDVNGFLDVKKSGSSVGSEWDYKIALVVITALAFATRFWGIGHPNEVVFDEVHFGKVRLSSHASLKDTFSGALISCSWSQ